MTNARRTLSTRFGIDRRALAVAAALAFALSGIRGAETQPFLDAIHVPSGLRPAPGARPVTIAIVDDAVRVSHWALRPFLRPNPRETPGNRVDDDGNGRVDDLVGWDVADDDADVSPPEDRAEMFYHGTHLAGIVAATLRRAYGPEASRLVRILPVKCLADTADRPYLKDGYKGIQYAVDAGADIILAAWGEAHPNPALLRVFQSALERGAIVVASAGNLPEEKEQFPAAFPAALAVSSVEVSGVKSREASYGNFVDLVAMGVDVESASAGSDTGQSRHSGTSQAAAMVAASAAILKLQRPDLSRDELTACLKNTADPVERFQHGEIFYGGKLGAGRVNLAAALDYRLHDEPLAVDSDRRQHQGYLAAFRASGSATRWRIRPEGTVKGFWFQPKGQSGTNGTGRFTFHADDTAAGETPLLQLDLADWKERRFVPGTAVRVAFEPGGNPAGAGFLIEYASEAIDQSTLYCRDTRQVRTERVIEDGSGADPYAPRSSCKWLITAPVGKVIRIRFLEFDTEARTDWVYFFNGAGTNEKMLAAFSGPRIPPELTTWGHQTLLWFVTNDTNQGRGWKAEIKFVDPVVPPPAQP